MLLIWLFFIIEILILFLIKPMLTNFNTVSLFAVIINILITTFLILILKFKYKFIFLWAFIVRITLLFWDLYARNIFVLPHSGLDSEMYYINSIMVSNNMSLLSADIQGGLYSKIIGFLFYLIGPQRIMAQYLNVLIGMSVIYIIYLITIKIIKDKKIISIIMLISSFIPNSAMLSAIFLREEILTFSIVLSLFFFVKWFLSAGFLNMILSFFILIIGSFFHSGVLGIFLGYIFSFIFYNQKKRKLLFSSRSIASFVIIIAISYGGIAYYGDLMFRKFQDVNSIDYIYNKANYRHGGSAYLRNVQISNPIELVIYAPIRGLYFLFAPLPNDWRSLMDMFTFFYDSIFYFLTLLIFFRKKIIKNNILALCIFLMILGATSIFGIGVSNAGTAIRHRQKLFPIFIILIAIALDFKRCSLLNISYENRE